MSRERLELTNLAVSHAQMILQRFLYMEATYGSHEHRYYPPAYDFLMISNAAITLIEFPMSIPNILDTSNILEEVNKLIQKSGRVDKVFEWACNVMRRIYLESGV